MAVRNPAIPQLDFPQLTADIIRQLRLTGTLGLFNMSDVVNPVYIVAAREGALNVVATTPVFGSGEIFTGFASVPAANAIVIDTGQLPAGDYDIFGSIAYSGTGTANGHIELQHRNAANAATLAVLIDSPNSGRSSAIEIALPLTGYTLALNERLRVQLLLAGNSGSVTGIIGARIRPTP